MILKTEFNGRRNIEELLVVRKTIVIFIVSLVLAGCATVLAPYNTPTARHKKAKRKSISAIAIKTIVIDPGHGGKDPGAVSPHGLKEKYISLSIARYLKRYLTAKGFKTYLTRNKDIYLTLWARVKFAREHNADLFISIHANSNHSRRRKGVEVYYFSSQSLDFARMVVSTLQGSGFKVYSPRRVPFYVLKYTRIPSVLIEVGYLTNAYEEKLLRKPYYQKKIAQGIVLSVRRFNWSYTKKVHLLR